MSRDMKGTPKRTPRRKKKKLGLPYDVEDNGLGTYSVDDDLGENNILPLRVDEDGNVKLPKGLSKEVVKGYLEDIIFDIMKDMVEKESSVDRMIDKQSNLKNLFKGIDEWDEG